MTTPRKRRASPRQATARKFLARTGRTPTTEWKATSGEADMQLTGAMKYGFPILVPAPGGNILRLGGLKLTMRLEAETGTADKGIGICVGLFKANAGESPTVNAVVPTPQERRRVFNKETWIDIQGHAPTLVQATLRGMLTLASSQALWVAYLGTAFAVQTLGLKLYWMAEWSQRETSIDG